MQKTYLELLCYYFTMKYYVPNYVVRWGVGDDFDIWAGKEDGQGGRSKLKPSVIN